MKEKRWLMIILGITLVFCGCQKGVRLSTAQKGDTTGDKDMGEFHRWKSITPDAGGFTNVVKFVSGMPGRVYLAKDIGGMAISDNYGDQWQSCSSGLNTKSDVAIAAIAIDPNDGNTLYIGAGRTMWSTGLFKSTDGGQHWKLLTGQFQFHSGQNRGVEPETARRVGDLIAVAKSNSQVVYIGDFTKGIFRSEDGGTTWTSAGLSKKMITSIIIDPLDDRKVYVSSRSASGDFSEGGIYRTLDGGKNWTALNENIDAASMKMDLSDSNVLYVAGGLDGIFKSTDGGLTWTKKNNGLQISTGKLNNFFISVAIAPTNSNILYCGSLSHGNVYKSVDAGDNWIMVSSESRLDNTGWWQTGDFAYKSYRFGKSHYAPTYIEVDPTNENRVIIAGRTTPWRTDDGGETWKMKGKGVTNLTTRKIASNPHDPNYVYIGLGDWTYSYSMDGGETFINYVPKIGGKFLIDGTYGFAFHPSKKNIMFMACGIPFLPVGDSVDTVKGTIFKSEDYGQTFTEIYTSKSGLPANNSLCLGVSTVPNIDGYNPNILYAAIFRDGIYKSYDNGDTWTKKSNGLPNNTNNDYVFENNKTTIDTVPILVNKNNPDTVYILERKHGVYKTTNGGENWVMKNNGLPTVSDAQGYISGNLLIDDNNPDVLYLYVNNHGIYITEDGAESWRKISKNEGISNIINGGPMLLDGKGETSRLYATETAEGSNLVGVEPRLIYTDDKGQTWNLASNNEFLSMSAIFNDLAIDYSFDTKGHILGAVNGGFFKGGEITQLFRDDFEKSRLNNWKVISGSWNIVKNSPARVYRQGKMGEASTGIGTSEWKNYYVDVKTKILSLGDEKACISINVRERDSLNSYIFSYVKGGKLQIKKRIAGVESLIAEKDFNMNLETEYIFTVGVNEDTLEFYIDDILQISVKDSSLVSGCISLNTKDATAEFDDVLVYTY